MKVENGKFYIIKSFEYNENKKWRIHKHGLPIHLNILDSVLKLKPPIF